MMIGYPNGEKGQGTPTPRPIPLRALPPRVLGSSVGAEAGATLIAIGGMHGNEVAGALALQRLLRKLSDRRKSLAGEFLALTGNRAAIAQRRRFLDLDLNRLWSMDRIVPARTRDPATVLAVEEVEQQELLREIEAAAARARGPVHVIDIHTISGTGSPFAAVGDAARNRPFARALPVPMVLGLNALVEGTLLGWLERQCFANVVFESGQHDDPVSVDRAEAALWLSLESIGMLCGDEHVEVARARAALRSDAAPHPRILELRHRHPLGAGDGFRMRPGYENLQLVQKGELLAEDVRGEIRARESAHILMPLYQDQGSDGFFLVRPTRGRM
jgi:predicted deacylase